ncbi:MAG: sigma factor-like helix-turn-helix DNA-binding protein, partial [Planctomycetota bacterium]
MRAALNAKTHSTNTRSADGESSLIDMIADQRCPDPADLVTTQNDIEMISELLQGISEREARVLRMRFGIGAEDPMTLSQIGEAEGLTRERIRQIENGALRTLGHIISKKRGYSDEIQGM